MAGELSAVDVPQLARVGDSIECDVTLPYPHKLREVLVTPEAAAFANELLMQQPPKWRLVRQTTGAA